VRFVATVTSGHATLATKRALPLTWAGLPPAGSPQLCLAHSFDHLVGERDETGLINAVLDQLARQLRADEFAGG